MHTLERYKLGFDPSKTDLAPIFECQPAKVLWMCIKSCHVTSQYFNDTVLEVGKELKEKGYIKYPEFEKITRPLNCVFGVVSADRNGGYRMVDTEFWTDIYKAIYDGRMCEADIKTGA